MISFNGTQITTQTGAGLHVIGGDISVNSAATLLAPGGVLTMFSAAGPGEVPFSLTNPAAPPGSGYGSAPFSQLGAIDVTGQSQVEIDGSGGGNLVIRGGHITVDQAYVTDGNFGASAAGGNIMVTADQLDVTGGGFIAGECFNGNDGLLTINVKGALNVSGVDASGNESAIFDDTEAAGEAGVVGITAASVNLAGGFIRAVTNGSGNAGVVRITTGPFSLSGGAVISTISDGSGNAGNVSIACSDGQVSGQSQISSSSLSTDAGNVQINAGDSFTLSGGSSISTSGGANGGNITLNVGRLLYMLDGNIQAYATDFSLTGPQAMGGNGGNILIDPQLVVMDNSLISASAAQGAGGNMTIITNEFLNNNSSILSTGTTDGAIDISAPDLNLSGSLVSLPAVLVNVDKRLRENCVRSTNHEFSSFIVVGRDGTESAPNELQADFGLRESRLALDLTTSSTR
jgi:large exoprotein involved in heme utilization and adhesion